MFLKNLFILFLLNLSIGCALPTIEGNVDSKKIEGKFSMFSEDTYLSGKISISNQNEISQIKINLKNYPKTFLITEIRKKDLKKYKHNFNESYEQTTVKNLIEELSIFEFSKWLKEKCNLSECESFKTKNILISKKEFYEDNKLKKIIGNYKSFKLAVIFKS
jgi:hypothetical protein